MAKEMIWLSDVLVNPSLVKGFDSDVFLEDDKHAVDAMRRNKTGEPLPADRFPKELYGKYHDKKYKKLPDICLAGGFLIVSAQVAEVLQRFGLGKTSLYPTKVYEHDRKTRLEGEHFCLSLGETKQCFDPGQSPNARRSHPSVEIWKLPFAGKDGDIAVSRDALTGPDMWMDPLIIETIFLSSPLAQALKAAKLTRRFGLKKCRVI